MMFLRGLGRFGGRGIIMVLRAGEILGEGRYEGSEKYAGL